MKMSRVSFLICIVLCFLLVACNQKYPIVIDKSLTATAVNPDVAEDQLDKFKSFSSFGHYTVGGAITKGNLDSVVPMYNYIDVSKLLNALATIQTNALAQGSELKQVVFAMANKTPFVDTDPLNATNHIIMFGIGSASNRPILDVNTSRVLYFNDFFRCPPTDCINITWPVAPE
jgi:hypothetical protein